jgi:mannose-6-phosphate isomerase-like protein (cupin superfamily)
MPKVSKQTTEAQDIGVGVVHEAAVDGYAITFMSLREDADLAPLLRGLPDDRCTCPHWGYVISGQVTFTFADHTEAFGAGDGFYVAPGHSPAIAAGTEYVMFSPEDQMAPVTEVIDRNLAAMQSA